MYNGEFESFLCIFDSNTRFILIPIKTFDMNAIFTVITLLQIFPLPRLPAPFILVGNNVSTL